MDLNAQRAAVRPLLAPSAPEDALAAYYALYHDPRRTRLTLHRATANQSINGFVAVCQTGQDLFRPLVVIRAPDDSAVGNLLHRALTPGRPYYLIALPELFEAAQRFLDAPEPSVNRIYRLDPARFSAARTAEINVLVEEKRDSNGRFRWEIQSGGEAVAVAGVNWRSPFCAGIYVYVEPVIRGRGWGRAVLRAATGGLLREGLLPLYLVQESNLPSIRLAKAVGYADTGHREIAGQITLLS